VTTPCIGPEFTAGPLAAPDKPWTTLQIKNAQPMAYPYDRTALPAGSGIGNDPAQGLWVDGASYTTAQQNTASLVYNSVTDPATLSTTAGVDNVLRPLDFTWTNPLCEPQQLVVSTRFKVRGFNIRSGQTIFLKAQAGDAATGAVPAPALWHQFGEQYSWSNENFFANWSLVGRLVRRVAAPANGTVTIVRRIAVNLHILTGGTAAAPGWPIQWAAQSRFMTMPTPNPVSDGW